MSNITLPKWLEKRYSSLWDSFGESPFRMEDAERVLWESNRDDKKQVSAILSELRKAGLLEVDIDPENARRRIYRLKKREETVLLPIPKEGMTRAERLY